jgi:hypothetical protein
LGWSDDQREHVSPGLNSAVTVLGSPRVDEHAPAGAIVAPEGDWRYTYEFAVTFRSMASARKV